MAHLCHCYYRHFIGHKPLDRLPDIADRKLHPSENFQWGLQSRSSPNTASSHFGSNHEFRNTSSCPERSLCCCGGHLEQASSLKDSIYARLYPLCKSRNSVKPKSIRNRTSASNRLLHILFMYLVFSSLLLLNKAVTAADCTPCPTNCECLISSTDCHVNCSGRLSSLPSVSEFNTSALTLDLSSNGLTAIPDDFFYSFTQLEKLLLHDNELSHLSKYTIEPLINLSNITLHNNPWTCSCDLEWMQDLVNGTSDLTWITVQTPAEVLCSSPSFLLNQPLKNVDLSTVKCASSYVSCVSNEGKNGTVIVWDYTDLETSITDVVACKESCYTLGHTYATVYSAESICLCSYGEASDSVGASCSSVCGISPPSTVCGRQVVSDTIHSTCIVPKFHGIRTYSQHQAVQLSVIPDFTVDLDYIWNFNDSTAVIVTQRLNVMHKYALPGTYYITVTVSCGNVVQAYGFPIIVEQPVSGINLSCDATVELNENINAMVDVRQGSYPRLSWTSSRNGTVEHDQTTFPSGATFFDEKRTAYTVNYFRTLGLVDAEADCKINRGNLAIADGPETTNFLINNVVNSPSPDLYWIGTFIDSAIGFTVFHINGHSVSDTDYTNWGENEPRVEDPSRRCVALNTSDGGKWYLMPCTDELLYICEFESTDFANEPRHYISGTTVFGSTATSALMNLTEVSSSSVPAGKKVYTLLFPGLWLYHNGVIGSWEFSGPNTQYNGTLRLQLFRPKCAAAPRHQKIRPGCASKNNAYSICGTETESNDCTSKIPTCNSGKQFCPITQTCQYLSSPCSLFAKDGSSAIPTTDHNLEYKLVSEHIFNIPTEKTEVYQMILKDGGDVEMDDIIGISFTHASSDISAIQITDLPLLCQSSNLSSWRQNVHLVQLSDWTVLKGRLDLTNSRWIESLWCDIRLHYSEEADVYEPVSSFLTPTVAGNYTYSVLAFNNASQSDASRISSSCDVEVRDSIRSVSVMSPVPLRTSPENYIIIELPRGSPQTIVLEIDGGGENIEANWQGLPDGATAKSGLETSCPGGVTVQSCLLKSNTGTLRITTTDITVDDDDDNLLLEVNVSNSYSSKQIMIQVRVAESITGLRILPSAITRVLASIPQVFTAEVDSGSGITYTWIVDDLTQFKYRGQQYNVLFRTPAVYVLTVFAENSAQSVNESITVTVDEMNRLSSLEFVGVPNPFLAQTNALVEFQARFLVDINIDYQVEWTINNDATTGPLISQPHTGDPDPDSDVERVYQTTAENATFLTTGEKEIEIRVYNDYDSITISTSVDVRSPLTSILIEMTSDVPAVGDDLQFQVTGTPSTYGASFSYVWGDGTTDDDSSDARITHSYSVPGTYTINVTADNMLNSMSNFTTITIYERITGLTVTSDGPTEIGLSTAITTSLSTGSASATFSYEFDDPSVANVANVTDLTKNVTYNSVGRYNISVTAVNPISTQQAFHEVQVFRIEIVDVNTTETCFKTNSNATIRAFATADVTTLFDYLWTFEDGSSEAIDSDNRLNYIFTSAGQHNVTARVTSKATGFYDEKSLIVCVQDEITSGVITDAPVTEIGQSTTFTLASVGGTDPEYFIDFGDGNSATVTLPGVTHTYAATGNYTVVFTARNLVSEVNSTEYLQVQEAVAGINIETSYTYAPSIANDLAVTYTATTTAGTDLQYEWDFGDGTASQNGNNTVHTYTTSGNYVISVNISNLVSSEVFTLNITVKEPVTGTSISIPASVVKANTSVSFTASIATGGSGENYYWKVTPGQNYTLGTSTFTYRFPNIFNYSVSVKVENEVSADYAEIFVFAADPITGLNITTDALVNDIYAPRGESTRFEAVLFSGENVSETTGGSEALVFSDWTISIGGMVEEIYNDSAIIRHSFEQAGVYIVHVNVSNGVSNQQAQIEVESIDRIGAISFINLNGYEGAAVVGEEIQVQAVASMGSYLEFYWDPDDAGAAYPYVNNENLTYTYSSIATYYPLVTVRNILGEKNESYELVVQEIVTGLEISHLDAVVDYYVPLRERTNFMASVASGTDISYSWYYVDEDGNLSNIENSTNPQMNWNFPKVTTYTLVVNASNLVSWDQVNYTVVVMQQIQNLDIVVDSLAIATNETALLNGSVTIGDNVTFQFFLDGNEISGTHSSEHVSYISQVFNTAGTHEITVVARNNVSVSNITRTISVRDPIQSVQIGGCCVNGQYFATNETFDFTAILNSGTDVTFSWEITYETGQIIQATGTDLQRTLTIPGNTQIKLTAGNIVSEQIAIIYLLLQDRCLIRLNVDDPGRTLYTNENITLNILVVQGTNVSHSILWGDLAFGPEVTTETSANHIYRLKGDYIITVNSSNAVSWTENTATVSISKIQCVAPSISFVQSSQSSKFFRSRSIYVESTLTTNCSAYEVAYSWMVYRQDDCSTLDESNVQVISVNTNKPMLILPALTLEVSNYCFEVEVSYEDTYLSDRSALSVGVVSTPLTVVIIGGTTRFLAQNVSLVLDAGRSFDPDVPADSSLGLSYSWSCNSSSALSDVSYGYVPSTPSTRLIKSSCAIPLEYQTLSQFELSAGYLVQGIQYDFTVEATKTGKTATTAVQRVVVVNRNIPTTTVICFSCHIMASYQISASFHVGLQGSCDTCSATDVIEYLWEIKKVENDGSLTDFAINSDTTTTGATSNYLVVKEGALESSYAYEFKLRILVNGMEGYSKLELQPNVPPLNGSCGMTYNDGAGGQIYVLDTVVSFSCSNWTDDATETDTPLVYTIVACRRSSQNSEDLADAFILYRGTREISDTYLPLGYMENNYLVNIKILVEDQLGTSTLALDRDVTVIQQSMSIPTIDWLQGKVDTDLNTLLRLNDPQNILDFSAAAITVLNSLSSIDNIGVNNAEYNQTVTLRELMTQTVADISATTLKEVQQVASVLEQCVKVPTEMQDPDIHQYVLTSVDNMASSLTALVNREGHSSFQRATNDVLDIVGGLIRVVNYAIYDSTTVTEISSVYSDVSTNFNATYRRGVINEVMSDINTLVTNVLSAKVVDEEAVTFLSPVVSLTAVRTTIASAPREQISGGVHWKLPDHIFDGLNSSAEIYSVSMVYEQNPFTYGFPAHSLASDGYANITSRVPTIEFTYPDSGEMISVTDLASPGDSNGRRVRLAMSQSSWEYLNAADTENTVNSSGSLYRPQAGLNFESTPNLLEPLQTFGITITNNNTDRNTAIQVMITYRKVYNNNKPESNPAIEAYLDTSPSPNKVNNTATLRITDAEMADGADHQLYTFFLDPNTMDTTIPQIYFNISNYFTYEILDVRIAVFYSMCLYYDDSNGLWATDGLYVSSESTYTVTVCYSDHLTSFGSFVINPPNLVDVTDIVNIDFSRNPVALIVIVVIMFLYIVGVIWARILDLRDIKRSSIIPLCGPNGSFKYEITIKTAAGIGSGTTANVGICVYGYDTRSGSRHLYRKDAFQRGAVDTMQIASDISLGEIYKIKLWHDNTGLDPGWCIDRVMVRDLQTESKYYFLVNSWLQVYPDDEDETCLEKTIRVATEEELMNFSNIFGSQLSYGWEDAHLWLSVIERPTRSRFTRVQRVTCCVTLLLTFMLFSAMWYQGYDADGEVIPEDTVVGIIRWKDIAVGAIVSLMVFPVSIIIICMFKKSKSKVAPVKPWLERSRTAQTIEILDEILGSDERRYPADIADSDDDDYDRESRQHRGLLPGHSEFLAEYAAENPDGGPLFHSRAHTPLSNKSKVYEASSQRSKLHKGSRAVKSMDIKDRVASKILSDDSAIQLSESPSTSGATESTGDTGISSEEQSSASESPDWPNRTSATKSGALHFQNEAAKAAEKFSSTSFMESPKTEKKTLRRRNTAYARNTDSASPPNFIPDDDDDDEIWSIPDFSHPSEDIVIKNKQALLRRTRGTKFADEEDIGFHADQQRQGLILDDVILSHSDDEDSGDDVPLPDFPASRGESRMSRASTHLGTSPQPSSEKFLLPHWCIYLNYFLCFGTMATCIFFIILYGNAFGADTTKRWLLAMFVALLESFFLIEPIKVVLFAVFLALITKPINPEENDNLVEEPLVETYGHTESFSKVRAPGGFALDKCKREANKTKRSNKLVLNLAIYLIFLSSVAAVASWDRDTMGYYNTMAIKESFVTTSFNLPSDAEGPRWQNNTATFNEIRTVTDIWAWLDQVFIVKIYEDKSTLDNENLNNNLLGKIRLRQQRDVPGKCFLDANGKNYNQLTHDGQSCLSNDASLQQTRSYGEGWATANASDGSWSFSDAEFGGVMYWGQDLMYDDSGYSQFLNSTSEVSSAQTTLEALQSLNWIDRNTRVLFVEFTQLNPATYWFTISVIMFEIGVTGAVRPSHSIQTVRIVVPSSSFYVDMLFMTFVGIIGFLLLLRELKKARNPRMTAQIYFSKWTNWLNLIVLALTTTLCVLFVYKEVYMEEVTQKYISDKMAFTNFYKIAFYTNLVTIAACSLLFVLILRATRLFRFVKSWSAFGETLSSSALLLLCAGIMLIILILGFAALGFLVYGQSYTQVIPDFKDFPNSIYSMFRTFRGTLDVQVCLDYSPVFTIFFFFSFYFGIFYIFCRIFAAIIINEYKFSRGRKSHLRSDVPDYEILKHLIARIKMRLGIIKPRQYRPMVRFEGMSTPSSRGSFMSLDSFDTYSFVPGRISQCSYATGISSSSSDSGFGTPSDHSLSVYDYLTLEPPSDTPMDMQHLDYLYDRLANYSVDMMMHRFERVSVLTEEVGEMETNAVKISILQQQRAMLQSQSKEIAVAASTMTIQPNYIPPETDSSRPEGSATKYSSRGHYSLHSQQGASQTSINSGRRSAISSDSMFQTVVHSMFPLRQSWVSDFSQAELDSMKKSPAKAASISSSSSHQQKIRPLKGGLRGTSSASAILKREGSSLSNPITASEHPGSGKLRPHSDEGARVKSGQNRQEAQNELNTRTRRTIIHAFRATPPPDGRPKS